MILILQTKIIYMRKVHIITIVLVIILVIFGIYNLSKQNTTNTQKKESQKTEENEASDAKFEEKYTQGAHFYIVDPNKSKLTWHATQNMIKNEHYGTVDIAQGVIIRSEGEFVAGDFVIDMTSMKDNDDNEFLIKHLKSEDFFDVNNHPTAKLKLLEISKTDTEDLYKIKANLTIKKITKEIEFESLVTFNDEILEATANFEIDRTEWDIRYASGKFFQDIGDKIIDDQLEFEIKIYAQI